MKNFQITSKEDGKKYWISRAMAVVGIIQVHKVIPTFTFTADTPEENIEPKRYFLVSKRGPGCPDHVGKWQCTCGYLDFDETLADAVVREIREELGLNLEEGLEMRDEDGMPVIYNFQLLKIVDNPDHDARQNVCFRYLINLSYDWVKELMRNGVINTKTFERGGEAGEVEEIKLVPVEDLDKYEWAFNHGEILKSIANGDEEI